ncbi:MAG: sensor histidine kinase, partial [Candidatus Obscuribacterales bacterium]|nr:sensor histidine kinase [Candidatus Obscuribacterales bacterium]
MRSNNATANISGLFKSALIRYLALAFLLLSLVEAALLCFLVQQVELAEKSAAHEYLILRASRQLSQSAYAMRQHRSTIDEWRRDPEAIQGIIANGKSSQEVAAQLDSFVKSSLEASLDPAPIKALDSAAREWLKSSSKIFRHYDSEAARSQVYNDYLDKTLRLYESSLKQLTVINNVIKEGEKNRAEVDLSGGLLAGLSLNILLSILLAYLLDLGISKPISRLAENCDFLKRGEVLPQVENKRTEIGRLQETFHEMSLRVAENERGRKSYIQLFKELQSAALGGARSTLNQLSNSSTLNEKGKNSFKLLKGNIDGMLQILETMTDGLSFNAYENIEIKPHKSNSLQLFQLSESAVAALLDKKRIRLSVETVNQDLEVDEHLISRVLINLLSNAVKFSRQESEIKMIGESDGQYFTCKIIDNGAGISPEEQSKLFKRFSQLESAGEQKSKGSGLGLLICKQIIEAHSGSIKCESEIGKGSCFSFQIPLGAKVQASKVFEKPNSPNKKVKSRHSIKTAFTALLMIFLLSQFAVAFALNRNFQEASKKAASYSKQKLEMLETQELFTLFLTWRQHV